MISLSDIYFILFLKFYILLSQTVEGVDAVASLNRGKEAKKKKDEKNEMGFWHWAFGVVSRKPRKFCNFYFKRNPPKLI